MRACATRRLVGKVSGHVCKGTAHHATTSPRLARCELRARRHSSHVTAAAAVGSRAVAAAASHSALLCAAHCTTSSSAVAATLPASRARITLLARTAGSSRSRANAPLASLRAQRSVRRRVFSIRQRPAGPLPRRQARSQLDELLHRGCVGRHERAERTAGSGCMRSINPAASYTPRLGCATASASSSSAAASGSAHRRMSSKRRARSVRLVQKSWSPNAVRSTCACRHQLLQLAQATQHAAAPRPPARGARARARAARCWRAPPAAPQMPRSCCWRSSAACAAPH